MALFVDPGAVSVVAIQRAVDVSDGLGAHLQVILLVPAGITTCEPLLAEHQVASVLEARPPARGHRLGVARVPLLAAARRLRRDEALRLVVVDGRLRPRDACSLADELAVPVLVARDARPGGWMAASDLRRRELPVLATTRTLAQALARDLVCFHNVTRTPLTVTDPGAVALAVAAMTRWEAEQAASRRASLARFAGGDPAVRRLVTSSPDTIDALLGLARDLDPDVVAIGHRPHSWLGRLLRGDTAERLVERHPGSALIVPLAVRSRAPERVRSRDAAGLTGPM